MANNFYNNNGGGGDKKYSTTNSWADGTVPTGAEAAYLTDDRTASDMLGETVTTAFADDLIISNYSGNIGETGSHLIFDSSGGSDSMTLKIERASGVIFLDVNTSDTVSDMRINATGVTNIAGSGAFTKTFLVRGRINLGMSGVLGDLHIGQSTTPRDVICDISTAPDLTNVYQNEGRVTNQTSQGTAFWLQRGGTHQYTGTGTIVDYHLTAGHFRFDGATAGTIITNLFVHSGVCDLTKTGTARTITNCIVYPGAIVDIRHVEDVVTFTNTPVVIGSGEIKGQQAFTAVR